VTEGYPPNARIAKRRLRALGVEVVQTYFEDNGGTTPQKGALPFRAKTFDVVMDRHEAYIASEVYRVLRPQGVFITQQVGDGNNAELHDFLQGETNSAAHSSWDLKKAVVELEAAGFHVKEQRAESAKSRFFDVGAIVYYLKAIPWEILGFSTGRYNQELRELHKMIRSKGFFEVGTTRFFVIAVKEGVLGGQG
jgi:SAM-dependent methyltransferase